MGNINGREDGGGAGGDGGSTSSIGNDVTAQDVEGAHVNYIARAGDDGEFMGHSPPPSPRVSGSPLMFTPQVPVAPLQRPDEMQPNNSWMHTSSSYEDMMSEQGIPTMITWSYDGKEVALFDALFLTRKPLQKSGKDFIILKVLPSGVYQYRFVVDGQWRYSPDVPWTQDEAGNTCNILDLQEYVPEDIQSISGFEPPQSPDSSYNNLQLGCEDYAKEPPLVPPHLQMTLLNAPSPHMEIPPPSSRPQHVVINHLYMQKGRSSDSVVALGSTHRFLSKYVTVVLYKSIQQ
ncbi:5-AMP-activated protein kinase, beta subunit, interaction domain-containing protein [Cynara cardunculus var. scolymus]|uniref:5-AMP-activated protein kinase, beta subunit, interaction domain-containing protein n=1 Tax=Cynara cardunculus var. scolymus TaxID=59895 RepID=A0A103XTV0_CYNCS|nr:5-AMP-activated protein kinase, beta subunit, interaction domain-containing protein [Cynara cardunculus var. scolymus]